MKSGYRLSVISCWLRVLGSWFLALGSWFLVLASWFLPLGSCLLVLGSLLSTTSYSQQKNIPLNHQYNNNYEYYLLSDSLFYPSKINAQKNIHSGFKPLIENSFSTLKEYNNKNSNSTKTALEKGAVPRKLFYRKLKQESLLTVHDTADKFNLAIDPLFNFEIGASLDEGNMKKPYKNTRGLSVRGDIGKNFSFESSFYENQAVFLNYINRFNKASFVVPGQGRWKQFKTTGYDFAMSSGYISYAPQIKNEKWHSNIQLGHGKHFVGDGYRSLLLSDNSFNYPYLRITTQYKKIQYTNLYAVFMNLTDGGVTTPPNIERLFQKKAASFQYLSWNAHKRLQVGLFQGLIWQVSDNKNKQHIKLPYANPLILSNTIGYGLRDTNNIILGSNIKVKILKSMYMYAQYVIDDISGNKTKGAIYNKQGYQAGIKYLNAFTVKNLHLQLEYNSVRPYTYSHSKIEQNYSHYNQAISHPLGANFNETIGILSYRFADFFFQLKVNYANIGRDSALQYYGNNIFMSDENAVYGTTSLNNIQNQGITSTVKNLDMHIGYLINPSTNMNIIMGICTRKENYLTVQNNTYCIYAGIRTSLSNIYYDF